MFVKNVDEKIRLFLFTPNNAEALFRLIDDNRRYLEKWMVWPPKVHSANDTRAFIKGALAGLSEMKEMACGIDYNGHFVGSISFNAIDFNLKKAVIGYWVAENYQGKGIITKSCRTLIDYAFTVLGMQKIEIRVAADNTSSQKVCERLGFSLEGIIKNSENLHGTIVGYHIYGLMNTKSSAL
ncbi:N-acetyltransferase [Marinomonas agarivorans]|nr:N-acetyltransferase [Marinomonas agarivorans]